MKTQGKDQPVRVRRLIYAFVVSIGFKCVFFSHPMARIAFTEYHYHKSLLIFIIKIISHKTELDLIRSTANISNLIKDKRKQCQLIQKSVEAMLFTVITL